MYYIFRFWGKLKSLRKYMHFNIFERSNIFNIFLTFSIQILTFPFNNFFSRFQKKMKCCRPPSFSSTIMGRSWADHGQIMGRPWAIDSCRKILKIPAFSDTVFFRKIMQICDFPTRLKQSVKLFLQTPYMFFGEKLLNFWIENQFYTLKSRFVKWTIHFTPRKRHVF